MATINPATKDLRHKEITNFDFIDELLVRTSVIETYKIIGNNPREGARVLYERYGKKFFNYAVRTWHTGEDDAWDLIYDTLYKIIDNIGRYSFESERKFSSFIFVMFCNALTNMYRQKRRVKERLELVPFNEMLFDESGENPALRAEREVQKRLYSQAMDEQYTESVKENRLLSLLCEALGEMEDWERILLIQRSHNTPYKSIAEFVDKPENQLKVYYQRTRSKLIGILNGKINSNVEEPCEKRTTK
ncbi:MAG: sigma-70 family RNA polymerase sigma factor [Bacteroidetes bacterium]|nr:sigma-70 family RNA polymerase sigma factor [Bacteroidota bacterium]